MRRWNGWGEESTVVELPDSARGFLAELVGQGARLPDASLEAALAGPGVAPGGRSALQHRPP